MFESFFIGVIKHKLSIFLNSVAAIVIISVIERELLLGLEFFLLIVTVGFVATLISELVLFPFGGSSSLKILAIGASFTIVLIVLLYLIMPIKILQIFIPIMSVTIAILMISSSLYNKFRKK